MLILQLRSPSTPCSAIVPVADERPIIPEQMVKAIKAEAALHDGEKVVLYSAVRCILVSCSGDRLVDH